VKCSGYIRPIQFVDPRCRLLSTQMQASELEPKWEIAVQRPAVQSIMPVIGNQVSALHREIDFRAFQDNMYISFLNSQLFLCQPGEKKVLGHWINTLLGQTSVEPALSLAAHSLATSFFGHVHKQPKIVEHRAQLYGLALLTFSLLLSDTQRCRAYETLACANALEIYEVIFSSPFTMRVPLKSLTYDNSFSLIQVPMDGYFMQVTLNDDRISWAMAS
jgi:hypothetical protein